MQTSWDIAQKAIADLPPYLTDDDLTVGKFWEQNKQTVGKDEAKAVLERLVEQGVLEKQERRRRGNKNAIVYVPVKKGK